MIDITRQPPLTWRNAKIPKKSGGFRELIIPNDELKEVQHNILQELYRIKELRPSRHAHGFVPFRNTLTGAQVHDVHADCIITVDLKDFFPSFPVQFIREELVKSEALAPSEIQYILKYCLYRDKKGNVQCPQGAPTTPVLTNIGMRALDNKLSVFAERKGYTYSRYADDITLAADNSSIVYNGEVKSHRFLIEGMKLLFKDYHLRINWKKVSVIYHNSPRAARRVTGINIRQDDRGYNAKSVTRHKARSLTHILWKKLQTGADPKSLLGDYQQVMGLVRYCNHIRSGSSEGFDTADPRIDQKKLAYIKERMMPYVRRGNANNCTD